MLFLTSLSVFERFFDIGRVNFWAFFRWPFLLYEEITISDRYSQVKTVYEHLCLENNRFWAFLIVRNERFSTVF